MTNVKWKMENGNDSKPRPVRLLILPYRHTPGSPRRAHRFQGLVQLCQIDLGDGLQFGQRGFDLCGGIAVRLWLRWVGAGGGEAVGLKDGVDALVNRGGGMSLNSRPPRRACNTSSTLSSSALTSFNNV